MHDLLIRGGRIVDGMGGEPFSGDVAIRDGRIVEIGRISDAARETVDADGAVVTPGYVDIHTHYDGQVTWDPEMAPSVWHGVTTIVQGNCGVGFAPVRPGCEEDLISQMEGVEDIPGSALSEGMTWGWESFDDYLDILDKRKWTVDVGTQVPHAAVRSYVMGDRAADPDASDEDIRQMTEIVRSGIRSGALGFSTSRILSHVTSKGGTLPGTFTAIEELESIADAMRELDAGVLEIVPRGMDGEISEAAHAEMDWFGAIGRRSGRPIVFSLVQTHTETDRWKLYLDRAAELSREGVEIHPVVSAKQVGILSGLQTDRNAFSQRPTYQSLLHLPFAQRLKAMRQPDVRAKILAEVDITWANPMGAFVHRGFDKLMPLGADFDIEPTRFDTINQIAQRENRNADEVAYDLLTQGDGRNFLMYPFSNYNNFNLDDVYEMLTHPTSRFGLGDAGAHCGAAIDAGATTLMLSYWVRDREKGPRVPLAQAVKWMTSDNAKVYGLNDRGRIAPGYKADVNVIDLDRLGVHLPEMIYDLPAKGRRLMQRAKGYLATVQSGEITIRNDERTEALPGRLIRGAKPSPA